MKKENYLDFWFAGLIDQCGSFQVNTKTKNIELLIKARRYLNRNQKLFDFLTNHIAPGKISKNKYYDMFIIKNPDVLKNKVIPRLYNSNTEISSAQYKLLSSTYFEVLHAEEFLKNNLTLPETNKNDSNGYSPFLLDLLQIEYSVEKKTNLQQVVFSYLETLCKENQLDLENKNQQKILEDFLKSQPSSSFRDPLTRFFKKSIGLEERIPNLVVSKNN